MRATLTHTHTHREKEKEREKPEQLTYTAVEDLLIKLFKLVLTIARTSTSWSSLHASLVSWSSRKIVD